MRFSRDNMTRFFTTTAVGRLATAAAFLKTVSTAQRTPAQETSAFPEEFVPAQLAKVLDKYYVENQDAAAVFHYPKLVFAGPAGTVEAKAVDFYLKRNVKDLPQKVLKAWNEKCAAKAEEGGSTIGTRTGKPYSSVVSSIHGTTIPQPLVQVEWLVTPLPGVAALVSQPVVPSSLQAGVVSAVGQVKKTSPDVPATTTACESPSSGTRPSSPFTVHFAPAYDSCVDLQTFHRNLLCFDYSVPNKEERKRFTEWLLNEKLATAANSASLRQKFNDLSTAAIAQLVETVFNHLTLDEIELLFFAALAEQEKNASPGGVLLRHFEKAKEALQWTEVGSKKRRSVMSMFSSPTTTTEALSQHQDATSRSWGEQVDGVAEQTASTSEEMKNSTTVLTNAASENALLKELLPSWLHFPPVVWGLFAFALIAHFMTQYMTHRTKQHRGPMAGKGGAAAQRINSMFQQGKGGHLLKGKNAGNSMEELMKMVGMDNKGGIGGKADLLNLMKGAASMGPGGKQAGATAFPGAVPDFGKGGGDFTFANGNGEDDFDYDDEEDYEVPASGGTTTSAARDKNPKAPGGSNTSTTSSRAKNINSENLGKGSGTTNSNRANQLHQQNNKSGDNWQEQLVELLSDQNLDTK
ncbi:unnamed protein product, partial [Amoebophrya sp. A120]|eukprot:GSA120T00019465001.1